MVWFRILVAVSGGHDVWVHDHARDGIGGIALGSAISVRVLSKA